MTRWCQSGCSEYFWEFHQNILCNPHRSVEKKTNAPVGVCIVEREVRRVLLMWASYKPKPFSTWGRRATSAEDHGSREHTSEATEQTSPVWIHPPTGLACACVSSPGYEFGGVMVLGECMVLVAQPIRVASAWPWLSRLLMGASSMLTHRVSNQKSSQIDFMTRHWLPWASEASPFTRS